MAAQKNGVGDRTNDPGRNSLRLLPSGPDRVGEGPVRRRPPTPLYQGAIPPGQVSGTATVPRRRGDLLRSGRSGMDLLLLLIQETNWRVGPRSIRPNALRRAVNPD